ncbi:hypothetical protein SIID45300_02707 [Candidatus Magnetaquicoccaceae bacterium FCR-1]|uniref:Glycosyl hydrolase family 32 N-terminal domain-containing protein n=1 Tax=Candidatus Magnetaquiglobus chichijimensis TaxID=3141448 RepID=A0ABQ0CBW2_9PROT
MRIHGWEKRGLVIKPDQKFWWSCTHAMVPTPLHIAGSVYRIYFSGRDRYNRSHIGYVVIDMHDPAVVLEYSSEPVLGLGALGCFDDNGVTPSCAVRVGDEIRLYYIGWNPGVTVRMHLFGGLAVSKDGGNTFQRWSQAPILERCPTDPYLNTAPWAVWSGEEWRLYYVCGTGWRHQDLPRYHIRMARSKDGLHWQRDGHVCIDFAGEHENALARPYVVLEEGIWKMWFAHKGEAYRLGYAESQDGCLWERMDERVGITVSSGVACDSEMIEYAAVINHHGQRIMYYNGNDYGKDGICLAVEA